MAFGDGSGKYAHLAKTMTRCGWSVFFLSGHYDENNVVVKSALAFGPLPTLLQDTPTSELCAFYIYLRHCAPYEGLYVFHSACSYVVDDWNKKCSSRLVSGWARNCMLWARIYELFHKIGEDLVREGMVKAHLKLGSGMGQYDKLCVVDNGYADKRAKWGVDKHPSSASLCAFIKNLKVAYKAICKLMASLPEGEIRPKLNAKTSEFKNPVARPQAPRHRFTSSREDGRYQCFLCLHSSARPLVGACRAMLVI